MADLYILSITPADISLKGRGYSPKLQWLMHRAWIVAGGAPHNAIGNNRVRFFWREIIITKSRPQIQIAKPILKRSSDENPTTSFSALDHVQWDADRILSSDPIPESPFTNEA